LDRPRWPRSGHDQGRTCHGSVELVEIFGSYLARFRSLCDASMLEFPLGQLTGLISFQCALLFLVSVTKLQRCHNYKLLKKDNLTLRHTSIFFNLRELFVYYKIILRYTHALSCYSNFYLLRYFSGDFSLKSISRKKNGNESYVSF